ncbi:MAG TPA: right-handed parallel beta-helix repeat-containing protein [Acidimicrobiia bacterium]|jgi:hypothetical protein
MVFASQFRRRHRVLVVLAGVAVLAAATAGCATGASAPANPGLAGTFTVPASIPSDCSRDVTADLLRWIASVGDGSTLRFVPNGCYRIDGKLLIQNRNNLTFVGNGATFKPLTDGTQFSPTDARARAVFFFTGGSNITLENLTVRGAAKLGLNPNGWSLEAQHAFAVGQTNGFHLNNIHAYDVYGDMVYIGPYTSNVLVENSTFDGASRMGWAVNGGTNIRFDHNLLQNVAHAMIDQEPPTTGALDGLTVSNNTFGYGRLYFWNISGASVPIKNVNIVNNTFVNRPMKIQAAAFGTLTNVTISGNVVNGPMEQTGVDQSGGGAFFIQNATGVHVTNNRVNMTWGRNITGVNLAHSSNVVVTGNTWNGGAGSVSYYDMWGPSSNVCWSNNLAYVPVHLEAPSGGTC